MYIIVNGLYFLNRFSSVFRSFVFLSPIAKHVRDTREIYLPTFRQQRTYNTIITRVAAYRVHRVEEALLNCLRGKSRTLSISVFVVHGAIFPRILSKTRKVLSACSVEQIYPRSSFFFF